MKYLLDYWNDIGAELSGRAIMLLLDYDGTLTPIVKRPEDAIVSGETRRLLGKLARLPQIKIAIISGRSLSDIKKMVGIKGIIYAGNHGLEIDGPKIKFKNPVSNEYRKIIGQIEGGLTAGLSGIRGVFVENKGLTLSVHYRMVDRENVPRLRAIVDEITTTYLDGNKIKVKTGKKVLEIRPPVEWNKGKAVLWILGGKDFFRGERMTIPVYMGDEATDEDAFRALGKKGITVFVGGPAKSCAQYYLRNTAEVMEFLRHIVTLFEPIGNYRRIRGVRGHNLMPLKGVTGRPKADHKRG